MGELSRTAKFYRKSEKGRKKRLRYQKKYNQRPEERERRSELTMLNRKMGEKGDGLDVSHKGNGKVTLKPQSVNRGSKIDTQGDKRARGKGRKVRRVKNK